MSWDLPPFIPTSRSTTSRRSCFYVVAKRTVGERTVDSQPACDDDRVHTTDQTRDKAWKSTSSKCEAILTYSLEWIGASDISLPCANNISLILLLKNGIAMKQPKKVRTVKNKRHFNRRFLLVESPTNMLAENR